jgi:hypothetical protein
VDNEQRKKRGGIISGHIELEHLLITLAFLHEVPSGKRKKSSKKESLEHRSRSEDRIDFRSQPNKSFFIGEN